MLKESNCTWQESIPPSRYPAQIICEDIRPSYTIGLLQVLAEMSGTMAERSDTLGSPEKNNCLHIMYRFKV